jgi:uncharacterized membrane protein YphA (DoxX/SURF4 family)
MKKYSLLGLCSVFLLPLLAFAHEVYVLDPTVIKESILEPRFAMLPVLFSHVGEFLFWGSIGVSLVISIFIFSIARGAEKFFSPTFIKLRPWAYTIGRVTIGLSFIAASVYKANYGPELPLETLYGSFTLFVRALLACIGICITVGVFVRSSASIALIFFGISIYVYGWYMLTYLSYLGEIIVLLLGNHLLSDSKDKTAPQNTAVSWWSSLRARFAPYSFLMLRIMFGISLIYSALYAKFWYNNLALAVAQNPLADHFYGIAYYLGFEPHFLVLGAGVVELVLGLFFVLGIEIRFTALFIEFWLILSLFYFGETVWPHIMLIGIPIMFILYGYDEYSLEGKFFKKGDLEPVL